MKQKLVVGLLSSALIAGAVFGQAYAASPSPAKSAKTSPTPSRKPLKLPDTPPESGVNMTFSPPFISLNTDPGESIDSEFKVRNNNNFAEYFKVEVNKIVTATDGTATSIEPLSSSDEFGKWISLSETEFKLDPNQTKTIEFTVSPPDNSALGYYYALVVKRIQENAPDQGAGVSGSGAVPVLLTVKSPNAKREVQIADFKTSKLFYEYLPTEFQITVKNTGNLHVAPVGDIFIDSMITPELANIPVNTARGNVLPNASRVYQVSWDDGFAVVQPKKTENGEVVKNSKGENEYETKYDFSKADKFRFGKYTAHLLLVYDNGERDIPLEATVSFWIIPWKILLGAGVIAALVLAGVVGIFVSIIKKLRRR